MKCFIHKYKYIRSKFVCAVCKQTAPESETGLPLLTTKDCKKINYFSKDAFNKIENIEQGYFWFDFRNELIVDIIKKYFENASRFCEFGCGTAYMLNYLNQKLSKIELFGSDVFKEALEISRKKVKNVCFFQSDVTKLRIDKAFDLIGVFDVIEHIDDDNSALRNIYQALKPGGGIIISVPQYSWLWSDLDEISYHKRRYHNSQLIRKAEQAGFTTIFTTSFVTLLFPLLIMSRLIIKKNEKLKDKNNIKEFCISGTINNIFKKICSIERRIIRKGHSLKFGGSLLYVGKK